MLTGQRTTTLICLGFIGMLCGVVPAQGDDIYGGTTCGDSSSPACEVTAGKTSRVTPAPDPTGTRPAVGPTAPREPAVPCAPSIPPGLTDLADQEAWRQFACAEPGSASGVFTGPTVSAYDLAAVARSRLLLPAVGLAASPAQLQLVNLPTWLWLSAGWDTVTASAAVPGVSVTARAVPTSVSWSMGDGTTIVCAGAGTAFDAGRDPRGSSPDCGHIYRSSSAGRPGSAFMVSATLRWTVTWSGAGQAGTFADMTTTGSILLRVADSHALNHAG